MKSRALPFLIASYGALLLLLLGGGILALGELNRIEQHEAALRRDLTRDTALLDGLRTGIFQSGILARDYFLAPNDPRAQEILTQIRETRTRIEAALTPSQVTAPAVLHAEIKAWWRVLDLMIEMARGRATPGVDAYFRGQLEQRRLTLLRILDEIEGARGASQARHETSLAGLYRTVRQTGFAALVLALIVGSALALLTARRLLRLERERSHLLARLVESQEHERREIARELHDDIAQSLAAIRMGAGDAARIAGEALIAVRRLALSLRPSMLDDLGLHAALDWQARETGRAFQLPVAVELHPALATLPDPQRTCIYRVAQEALRNAARHARATKLRLIVEQVPRAVIVRVEDDGCGFDPGHRKGLGLLGMEERVRELGGRLAVHSAPGQGTRLRAELPLGQPA